MQNLISFGDVLEAVDSLSFEEQEALIDILNRRLIEYRRAKLAEDVQNARKEFDEGHCQPTTPDELMKELLS